jgi:hypothetical protein
MANLIDTNHNLQETYQPKRTAVVRLADAAHVRSRTVIHNAANTSEAKEMRSQKVDMWESESGREKRAKPLI